MICLYAEIHLSNFTFIFYTCICIPFLQIIQTIQRIFTFFLDPHFTPENTRFEENPDWELDLPVCEFQDLELRDKSGGEVAISSTEEMCSICLMEFQQQDLVNKLPKCGHVFHMGCLEKWLDRCQFTCPLCRSFVLQVRSSPPCKMQTSVFCINLPAARD
ncbi:hypothetical protein CDL12_04912 [Handroanthus impetiginosus]|uniref:RING-type domain-containing protein n=1 Tax=Handroanthus impetiginosus TaxID=429701 RepID=A0A2G9HY22_9LAMI|nr:hypothetical protein CDL12_04912 [Handroanthus impetiginosus]